MTDHSIPLSAPVIAGKELEYIAECIETGWLSGGPIIDRFEATLARTTGVQHAVACSSGTAALHVSLLLADVRPGDTVIAPTLTFAASINAIVYCGARPVLLGCDEFMNLAPELLASFLAAKCHLHDGVLRVSETGSRVAAIMPVHVFGNPCDMESILAVADEYDLPVVEDAAESLGSRWVAGDLAGRHTGTVGVLGGLSFNGNKIVTCGGGGAILTNDGRLAQRARYLINQAKDDGVRYIHHEVGFNYRLTATAAAIGLAQLEQLEGFIATKKANHTHYSELLRGIPGLTLLGVPAGTEPNHWFYTLLIDPGTCSVDREGMMAALAARGIQTRPLWYPNHLQRAFPSAHAYEVDRAMWFWERALNLPCSSDLSVQHVERVCAEIRSQVLS